MEVAQSVDGRHVAAAEDVAFNRTAQQREVGRAVLDVVGRSQCIGDALVETHVGMGSASHDAAHHMGEDQRVGVAVEHGEVGVVVGRERHSRIFMVGVVVRYVVVVVEDVVVLVVDAQRVAVVVTVASAHGVAHHSDVAGEEDVGTVAVAVAANDGGGNGGAHVAADIVAAVDVAEGAAVEHTSGGVEHVGHTAAAVDVVTHDVGGRRGVDDGADGYG